MNKIIILVVLFLTTAAFAEEAQPTKIFLIRHAQTASDGSDDPALSAAGEALAGQWAAVFASEAVDMIYSTDYKRTQGTAEVIAASQGDLAITSYDPRSFDLENLKAEIEGKTVVIVGHSNTTPMVANGFLGSEEYTQFAHEEFDTVIIVQYTGEAPANAAILHLK